MGTRLNAKKTPVDFLELAAALKKAWQSTLQSSPTDDSLCVLLAHSALETGHWKSAYCYNLGNIKATDSWDGDYCYYPADEVVPQSRVAIALRSKGPRTDGEAGHNMVVETLSSSRALVTLWPDHPWCRFRAFKSLEDGAKDYLKMLNGRFAPAWPALESGDPEQFVKALKRERYFTASIERYLPPVLSLFKRYKKALSENAKAEAPAPPQALPVPVGDRPTLRPLPPDPHVLELQQILTQQGYGAELTVDGLFNERTQQAVELFQLQHIDQHGKPLTADGVVGKKTWWALLNPSGEAQQSFISRSSVEGLTPKRAALLELLFAEHKKGVKEVPDGSNRSPDIDRYWGKTGLIGYPWCAAFVSWALHEVLDAYPIKVHHVSVQRMWHEAKTMGLETTEPKPGDLFVQIKSGGKGHTGFVAGLSADGNTIYTCEGNCGNRLKLGQRPRNTIHHFIDALADGQSQNFPRGQDTRFEVIDDANTR